MTKAMRAYYQGWRDVVAWPYSAAPTVEPWTTVKVPRRTGRK